MYLKFILATLNYDLKMENMTYLYTLIHTFNTNGLEMQLSSVQTLLL